MSEMSKVYSGSPDVPIHRSEELFRLLVEAVNDYAIFALDPTGHVLTWNSGARRLKGYTAQEAMGLHLSRFYMPADKARKHPEHELELATQNGSYQEEGWRVRKDGTRFWASVLITALKDPNGKLIGFAKVTRDLTGRKIAEDQLREAYGDLEKRVVDRTAELTKAKNEAEAAVRTRDEFLSIASHELKTPLTTLKLQIQTRRRQISKGILTNLTAERFKAMIEDDDRQVSRVVRLVDDMLDISRLNSEKFVLDRELTELRVLVQEVVDRFAPQFESLGIPIELALEPGVVGNWDRFRIEQVLANLLTNAIKYGDQKPLTISLRQNDRAALLSVRDHGIGIALDDQARVFQRFECAISANAISGLGLGLYIARQIVEAHGGKLTLESELGAGSIFLMELPLK